MRQVQQERAAAVAEPRREEQEALVQAIRRRRPVRAEQVVQPQASAVPVEQADLVDHHREPED